MIPSLFGPPADMQFSFWGAPLSHLAATAISGRVVALPDRTVLAIRSHAERWSLWLTSALLTLFPLFFVMIIVLPGLAQHGSSRTERVVFLIPFALLFVTGTVVVTSLFGRRRDRSDAVADVMKSQFDAIPIRTPSAEIRRAVTETGGSDRVAALLSDAARRVTFVQFGFGAFGMLFGLLGLVQSSEGRAPGAGWGFLLGGFMLTAALASYIPASDSRSRKLRLVSISLLILAAAWFVSWGLYYFVWVGPPA